MMKGWISKSKSEDSDSDSDGSRILFVVFEDDKQKKNLLAQETSRHRLAYAQAKNPRSMIVSADVMAQVSVGHSLKVTSDRPTYMAIDTMKGTFREHKGKLSNVELDKFVREVESGHLNIVRKLQSHAQTTQSYTDRLFSTGYVTSAVIVGSTGYIWDITGDKYSDEDGQVIKSVFNSTVTPSSITLGRKKYDLFKEEKNEMAHYKNNGDGVITYKTYETFVVGFYDKTKNVDYCDYGVRMTASEMKESYI